VLKLVAVSSKIVAKVFIRLDGDRDGTAELTRSMKSEGFSRERLVRQRKTCGPKEATLT
jgi:hypothetical protein